MRRYPQYKESGVEWLEEVPEDWSLTKLKHVAYVNPTKGHSAYNKELQDEVTFLPMENVSDDGVIDTSLRKPVDQVWSGYTYFEEDDTIVAKITPCFENGKGAHLAELGSPIGFGSTEFHVLRPRPGVTKGRFLYYLTYSHVFRTPGEAFMTGAAGQKRVPTGFVEEFEVALPSLSEQFRIVDYLDRKTAQIDTLIQKKQALIDLLRVQRATLINRAVTKGLDPDVPMKDSGIEWLGEVPEHWTIPKIKFVGRVESGHTPSRRRPEYWENCEIPWFTLADVWQLRDERMTVVTETKEKVSELGLANSSARLLPAGTVILSRTASVGFSGILGVPMATSQDFVCWICGPMLRPRFLLYVLRAMGSEFRRLLMGSTHKTIYMPDANEFVTPLPPPEEQDAIIEHVEDATRKLDAVITVEAEVVSRIRELRASLISEVVTGKIDVRDSAESTESGAAA